MTTQKPTLGNAKAYAAPYGLSKRGKRTWVLEVDGVPTMRAYAVLRNEEANTTFAAVAFNSAAACEAMGYDGTEAIRRVAELIEALKQAKAEIENLAQVGTSKLLEMGVVCDPWQETARRGVKPINTFLSSIAKKEVANG